MENDSEAVTFDSGRRGPCDLRFLHFNDVYHVDSSSQHNCGGITRFMTLCNYYRSDLKFAGQPELLTFFSGDAYNPSLESAVSKGAHMVPVLNNIGTTVACVGNHDLDFGVAQFRYLASKCDFPWLLGNVLDPALGKDEAIANCKRSMVLKSSTGIRVGVVGLGEREWLDTINSLPPNLIYKSASLTAEELVPSLREDGADLVIALTHQREPNDIKLAEKARPAGLMDIILGGHDHMYNHEVINGTHVLRSGSDFKQLRQVTLDTLEQLVYSEPFEKPTQQSLTSPSYIEAWRKLDGKGWDFTITRRDITRDIPKDPETVKLVESLTSSLKTKLEKPVGYSAAPLDGRFTTVRSRESNLGNFVTDLMRYHYHADCAIMAAGTIRSDMVHPPGIIRLKMVLDAFPFEDPVVILRVRGKAILEALENGVSKLPALEGRFPQVSNIMFEFDDTKPPMSRIMWAKIGDSPIDMEKEYVLATRGYMGRGKDGYSSLLIEEEGGTAVEIVNEENGVMISTILRQYFMSLKVLGKWARWSPSLSRHWGRVTDKMAQDGGVKDPSVPSSPEIYAKKQNRPRQADTGLDALPVPYTSSDGRRLTIVEDYHIDSDSEDEVDHEKPVTRSPAGALRSKRDEHNKMVMRKVTRKWLRLAGITRQIGMVEEGEFLPHWTRGIAPGVEGRIVIAGQKA